MDTLSVNPSGLIKLISPLNSIANSFIFIGFKIADSIAINLAAFNCWHILLRESGFENKIS